MAFDVHACYRSIVTELQQLQQPGAWRTIPDAFPGLISAGPDGSVVINGAIEREIRAIADWMLDQQPGAKKQHTLKEWRATVRQAFGPALAGIDLDKSAVVSGRILKRLIDEAIRTRPKIIPLMFTSIGCGLFHEPLTSSLKIGPVLFESKAEWLSRAEQTGQVSRRSRDRLSRAFGGRRLRKLKNARQDLSDRQVVDVLANAQMVCTIETRDLAPELSQVRAIIGARLAQAAIALLWARPSTVLGGFYVSVDHGSRHIATVPYVPGRSLIGGRRVVGAPAGKPNDLDGALSGARDLFQMAGRMIECWTSATAFDQAPPIMRSLAQGLCFFWEACRDDNDLMAIVKFTAVLEALAPPGMEAGIKKLIRARLGVKDGVAFVGERDLDQVTKWLYRVARSRTLHGTNPEILHDWTELRAVAEQLTRHCLVQCMIWLDKNPVATKTEELLV